MAETDTRIAIIEEGPAVAKAGFGGRLRKDLRFTAALLFTAGAREGLPGFHGLLDRLTNPDQFCLLEFGPNNLASYSSPSRIGWGRSA